MIKILITGGAGFIGVNLSKQLLEEGNDVLIIDNFLTSSKENLKSIPSVKVVEGSICNSDLLENIFSSYKPDIVVHAAASYHDPSNWVRDIEVNAVGTVNIIRASEKYKIKRLIYLQTSLSYGLHPLHTPTQLDDPLFGGTRFPGSSYAASKTMGELYLELSDIDTIIFRLANVYGPLNRTGPIPSFFKKLRNGQSCTIVDTRRDFIYVDDIVSCVVKAIGGEGRKGAYHLSTGRDYSILDVYKMMVSILKNQVDFIPEPAIKKMGQDDTATILLDPSKTKEVFDWEAKENILDGLSKTIAWYNENLPDMTFTHLKNID